MQSEAQVKVWDPLVRTFHWVLVASFTIAFITEDDFMDLHVWAGYTVGIALIVRLIWGFIGTQHARFSDFVTSPGTGFRYAKDAVLLRAKRYIGHNPAGGLMIIVIMVSLLITTITGIALYGAAEQAGPLASTFAASGDVWENVLEETHEFFANFTLLLVVVHVAGVVLESMLHKENLVSAMISGFKRTN